MNSDSGFTIRLYPTFYSNKDEFLLLSSSKTKQAIANIVNSEVRKDDGGDAPRLRLELTPFN